MSWLSEISRDITRLPSFFAYFEDQLIKAKDDVKVHGLVEKNLSMLPGITEERFGQLQEIEAVLKHLELKLKTVRGTHFRKYLEGYNKVLSSRDAEKFADGEQEVIDMEMLVEEVALIRNRYLAIIKGLDSKNFMLGHLTKLKCAGMEDFSI